MIIRKSTNFPEIEKFLKDAVSAPTHWPDWNRIISKYYHTDFYYYTAYEKDVMIGICPIHETGDKSTHILRSGQFWGIPNGGWLFNQNISITAKTFPLTLNEALQGFSIPRIEHFQFTYDHPGAADNASTLWIDLTQDEESIWKNSVDSKRRNMIRKAEKNGLVSESVTQKNFPEFYSFYHQANTRYGLQSLPEECLYDIFYTMPNVRVYPRTIWYEASIISANVMVYDKDYALYWLGLNATPSPNLGQGEWLQWEAIRHARESGCRIYDLCFIDKVKLPSIYEFKKGFSQQEAPITVLNIKPLTYRILNRIQKIIFPTHSILS